MKLYHILKPFNGSQNGHDHHQFMADTDAHLSDDLAAIAVSEGWADPVAGSAHNRDTKVTGPDETKPEKHLNKMSKAELVAHALARGLELVPDSMTVKQMVAAIETHIEA